MFAEGALDGYGFQFVPDFGRSTMCIDVAHLRWLELGVVQSVQHDTIRTVTVFCGLRYVMSIPAHAITDDLCQYLGSASACELQFFQNQDACTLSNYKSVPLRIPWPAGLFRSVVPRGKRSHGGKTAHTHGSDGGLGSSRYHHVGVAAGNNLERIADRVSA